MRICALNLLLVAGLCCLIACLGKFRNDDQEPAPDPAAANGGEAAPQEHGQAKDQAQAPDQGQEPEPKLDPRHQRRMEAMAQENLARHEGQPIEDLPLDDFDDTPKGSEVAAQYASQEFVKQFVHRKHGAQTRYNPLMKYSDEDKEWRAFGSIQNKARTQGFTVECFIQLNNKNEWVCRRIKFDEKTVYHIDSPDQGFQLDNIKTGEDGRLVLSDTPADEVADDAHEDSPETEAKAQLKLARSLISRQPDAAKERLQKIIDEYPDTPSAAEAKKLMQRIR